MGNWPRIAPASFFEWEERTNFGADTSACGKRCGRIDIKTAAAKTRIAPSVQTPRLADFLARISAPIHEPFPIQLFLRCKVINWRESTRRASQFSGIAGKTRRRSVVLFQATGK